MAKVNLYPAQNTKQTAKKSSQMVQLDRNNSEGYLDNIGGACYW